MGADDFIAFRCPACEAVRFRSSIRDGRFRCGACRDERAVRNPDTLGDAETIRTAAAELAEAAGIEQPWAHSVLLELIRLDEVQRFVARPEAEARPEVPEPVPEAPEPIETPVASRAAVVATDARGRSWLWGTLVVAAVSTIAVAAGLAVRPPEGPDPSSTLSSGPPRGDVRVDTAGRPVEVSGQSPEAVLRDYCARTRCRPEAIATPSWLETGAKLGVFRDDAGSSRAGIVIRRRSSTEWAAGDGDRAIPQLADPELPPGTASVPVGS